MASGVGSPDGGGNASCSAGRASAHYAAQRWSESGTPLLLLSFCSVALALASSFSRWILELHHDLPVTDLTLGPLTLSETLHLLEATAHQQLPHSSQHGHLAEIGEWLFRETAGQPFYLVETLKDLLEQLRAPQRMEKKDPLTKAGLGCTEGCSKKILTQKVKTSIFQYELNQFILEYS